MSSKAKQVIQLYNFYVGQGIDKPDACVMAIDEYAKTWTEYVRVYNEIKNSL